MSDNAIKFIWDNREAARSSKNWDDFCATMEAKNGAAVLYHKHAWLIEHYNTARAFPHLEYMPRALAMPDVKSLSELFESFTYEHDKPHPVEGCGRISPKGFYISCPLNDHRGGERRWDAKREVMTHSKGHFYGLRGQGASARIKEDIAPRLVDGKFRSIECVQRDDGFLVIARDGVCISSTWLTLLPLDYNFAALLPDDVQAFIRLDDEEEKEAWRIAKAQSPNNPYNGKAKEA